MYTKEDVIKILKKIGAEIPSTNYDSVKLVDDGVLDSLQIMQLFMELEDVLGITIDQEEINPENLENIDTVVIMMNRLAQ